MNQDPTINTTVLNTYMRNKDLYSHYTLPPSVVEESLKLQEDNQRCFDEFKDFMLQKPKAADSTSPKVTDNHSRDAVVQLLIDYLHKGASKLTNNSATDSRILEDLTIASRLLERLEQYKVPKRTD